MVSLLGNASDGFGDDDVFWHDCKYEIATNVNV